MALTPRTWGGKPNAAHTDGTPRKTIRSGPKGR